MENNALLGQWRVPLMCVCACGAITLRHGVVMGSKATMYSCTSLYNTLLAALSLFLFVER